jgi:hypothetical protein
MFRKVELILSSIYYIEKLLRLVRRISETGRAAILKRGIKDKKTGETYSFNSYNYSKSNCNY